MSSKSQQFCFDFSSFYISMFFTKRCACDVSEKVHHRNAYKRAQLEAFYKNFCVNIIHNFKSFLKTTLIRCVRKI